MALEKKQLPKQPLQKMKTLLKELESAAHFVEEMIENYEDGRYDWAVEDADSLHIWIKEIVGTHKGLEKSLANSKPSRMARNTKASLEKTAYWTKVFDKAAKAFNKGDRDPAEKAAFEYLKGYMSRSMAEEWAQTVVYSWLRKPIKGRDIEEACENAITNAF